MTRLLTTRTKMALLAAPVLTALLSAQSAPTRIYKRDTGASTYHLADCPFTKTQKYTMVAASFDEATAGKLTACTVCRPDQNAGVAAALSDARVQQRKASGDQSPNEAMPFGLRMGMTRAEVEAVTGPLKKTSGLPEAPKVPRPHTAFQAYNVLVSQVHGLCVINAVSNPIQMNAFGDQLKSAMKGIADQLSVRYGPADAVDFLKRGSIWDDPEDWSMALSREERIFGFSWSTPLDAPSLSNIDLQARALSRDVAGFILTYRAKQFDACKAETEKAQSSVF